MCQTHTTAVNQSSNSCKFFVALKQHKTYQDIDPVSQQCKRTSSACLTQHPCDRPPHGPSRMVHSPKTTRTELLCTWHKAVEFDSRLFSRHLTRICYDEVHCCKNTSCTKALQIYKPAASCIRATLLDASLA